MKVIFCYLGITMQQYPVVLTENFHAHPHLVVSYDLLNYGSKISYYQIIYFFLFFFFYFPFNKCLICQFLCDCFTCHNASNTDRLKEQPHPSILQFCSFFQTPNITFSHNFFDIQHDNV